MFAGPLFTREARTLPRQWKHYLLRAGYVSLFTVLTYTAGQTTFGFQKVHNVGDVARFGEYVFRLAAGLQLTFVLAASLLFCSGSIAQEKDRRTLILLLMTDLRNYELVLGKLLASLLPVLVLIGVSLPVLCFLRLLGGITLSQVLWLEGLCIAVAFAAGSWGTLVAYWRDKTFQTLAITVLGAMLLIGLVELLVGLWGSHVPLIESIGALNPYRALSELLNPLGTHPESALPVVSAWRSVIVLGILALALMGFTCQRVRVWNPSRYVYEQARQAAKEETEAATRTHHRHVWDQPVIWREICTRAYGRKMILIKAAYVVMAGFLALWAFESNESSAMVLGMISREGAAFVILTFVGLLLVTAQSVTALTSERDAQTLELLLVTDITAKEFIFGKLGGVLYNVKEVLLVPLLFLAVSTIRGQITSEHFAYLLIGLFTLAAFCAMLGLHAALTYDISRQAILHCLGTVFFLFAGVFLSMVLIVEARGSFEMQMISFGVFLGGGALGLYVSLTSKNPSPALVLTSLLLPFITFYAIMAYLSGDTLGVCATVLVTYGFASAAMLIPAVSEFDYALGRTTLDHG